MEEKQEVNFDLFVNIGKINRKNYEESRYFVNKCATKLDSEAVVKQMKKKHSPGYRNIRLIT